MRKRHILIIALPLVAFFYGCQNNGQNKTSTPMKSLDSLFENYYNDRMKLFPLEATTNGDNRYNNLLPIDISDSYRSKIHAFYQQYLDSLATYKMEDLPVEEQISYEILAWDLH